MKTITLKFSGKILVEVLQEGYVSPGTITITKGLPPDAEFISATVNSVGNLVMFFSTETVEEDISMAIELSTEG